MSADKLASMRRAYEAGGLDEADLAPTWPEQFERWLADAIDAGLSEANAMIVSTAAPDGTPSSRTVLLKGIDDGGFTFFTNFGSRKGTELTANPRAALVFPWYRLRRQVVVHGAVTRVADAEADAYWASRPHGSRLGALASPQSSVIPSRDVLEAARDDLAARYPEGSDVPRPAHWGGFRVTPISVEFWQGRPDRLHDRLRYRAASSGGGWTVERLAP